MKNRLLIIDGHNLLFQMFFGMQRSIPGKHGGDVRGVIGFIGAVGKLTKMLSPTHLAIIFDSATHNPRCDINKDYKANRIDYSEVPDEENPFTQLKGIYAALDFLGIRHTEIENAEADDVIASYAMADIPDTEIFISSYDSDYFQLISERVKIIRYKGDASYVCDMEYLSEKLGIEPCQYADHKSIVGDTADNIKGIPGIGPKGATKLINEYGSLLNMYDKIDLIGNEKIREKLKDYKETVFENYSLIKLFGNTELPFSLDETVYSKKPIKTIEIISSLDI